MFVIRISVMIVKGFLKVFLLIILEFFLGLIMVELLDLVFG